MRRKVFRFGVCCTLVLSLDVTGSSPLLADEARLAGLLEMSLDELVEVTVATGTPKPLKFAPAVASVITAEEIKNIGARTVNEALETVPGLHVGVSTKNAMSQVYSLRGIHTSINPQVLLLLNGVPISNLMTGTRPFFNMPVAAISRIEVIRGPGSALYGADAFAGTINIITMDGKEIGTTRMAAGTGSFDSHDLMLQHGGQYHGWDLAASLEYQTSGGDPNRVVASDLQRVLDGVLGTAATVTPGALETGSENLDLHLGLARDSWTFRFWSEVQENDNYDGVTNVVSRGGQLDLDQYLADLVYENDDLAADFVLTGRLTFMYLRMDSLVQVFSNGALLPVGADGNFDLVNPAGLTLFPQGAWGEPVQTDKQTGAELTGLYTGVAAHTLRAATGYKYQMEEHEERKNFGPGILDGSQPVQDSTLTDVTGTDYIYIPDETRQLVYLSLQDEWAFAEKWELVAGLRDDHYSDFGNTLNPRLALVWETRPDLTTKLLYGRAFRPPSFTELYVRNNPSNSGNPDLEPETIETVEFATDYQPRPDLRLKLNLFHYEIEDLIELVQDPGQTTLTSQNSKDQEGRGFELEGEWLPLPTLLLKGNLAYQNAEDAASGEPVADAPQWQAYLNGHWHFLPDWSLDGQYFRIAGRQRAAGDPRAEIRDNDQVNLTLRRSNIAGHWELAVAARNLFDTDLREPGTLAIAADYPLAGRSLWVELRFTY